MDYLIGIVGKDFTLMAADCSQARSIIVMKKDMDKSKVLSDNTLMLASGEVGDTIAFGEYISKNLKLNKLRNGLDASPWSSANYVRHQLATALRSRNAYQVNMLVGGFGDGETKKDTPQLYFIDHLAAMTQQPFACQGYGGYFTYSVLDKHYKPGMDLEETMDLLKRCIKEVRHRFMVQMPRFKVHVIDKDGIRHLDDIFEL